MSDYAPIACLAHEKLEFAVLKRQRLRLQCRDIGEIAGIPLDVYTKDKAEWLRLQDDAGVEHTVRLDRILTAEEI
jgi:Rho-binding antiterminator